jgi:hypothetical protein
VFLLQARIPTNSNGLSARVRAVADALTKERGQEMKVRQPGASISTLVLFQPGIQPDPLTCCLVQLTIVKQKEVSDSLFVRYLVEDKVGPIDTIVHIEFLFLREHTF